MSKGLEAMVSLTGASPTDTLSTRFTARILAMKSPHVIEISWAYDDRLESAARERLRHVTPPIEEVGVEDAPDHECWMVEQDGSTWPLACARLYRSQWRLFIVVAGADRIGAEGLLAGLRIALPPAPDVPTSVRMAFWYYTEHGPRTASREIAVPAWQDIRLNYAGTARAQLDAAMRLTPARLQSGHMLVWTGAAGTGKTFAIRALVSQWREWATFQYVTDPEKLFGTHADYLVQVLLNENVESHHPLYPWRVLVLEDAGELMAVDARERMGQGLSRLLNAVDGLLGQGLRLLVLVTTNEETEALHPAVSRPERCLMHITFTALTGPEANQWLLTHGAPDGTAGAVAEDSARTLAELYAMLRQEPVRAGRPARRAGF